MKNEGFFWHVHHDVLLEYCYDYQERVDYINVYKPKKERELRLRLFQPVQGELPNEVVEAGRVYERAYTAYSESRKAYWKARAVYEEVLTKHEAVINALHEKECSSCTWDGKNIFEGQ